VLIELSERSTNWKHLCHGWANAISCMHATFHFIYLLAWAGSWQRFWTSFLGALRHEIVEIGHIAFGILVHLPFEGNPTGWPVHGLIGWWNLPSCNESGNFLIFFWAIPMLLANSMHHQYELVSIYHITRIVKTFWYVILMRENTDT